MIRRCVALHDEHVLGQTIGSAATRIAALDPEVACPLTDGAPAPVETDAVKARFRLFDSVAGLPEATIGPTPSRAFEGASP